ncbi:hypothetical protein FH972_025082 [Carpinus fangiana]|uniref:Major facilitator superfamily (MFS) profile domain-containing protein n=1 Tax=Carpinus fangiana TaxID=176857 RepID=A0A5N6L2I6_9ROSI|nr:hypothetical protein FH972_025082 [Carpinus fangiana]
MSDTSGSHAGTATAEKAQIKQSEAAEDAVHDNATLKPSNTPGPPPNGGAIAWLHVLGSFMLYFNTWGIQNAFGVFQTYYESRTLFHESSSNISWIGSVGSFMLLFAGLLVGPIFDRGYLRTLLLLGSFMVVFGHMMLSLCHTYWEVVLAQGFVIGIGTGCLFVPCVAIIPQYFSTRIGLALGVAVSGSALGGVIYPIVLYQLIGRIGFPWAVRVIGFIALGTLLVPIMTMKLRVKPPKARALLDWSAFVDFPYMFFVLNTLLAYIGLFVVLFYLSYYADEQDIADTELAFYLVPIFNAASIFGRMIPNALASRFGALNLLVPAVLSSGTLMLCMMAVHSEGAVIVMALLFGFMSGALIGLVPLCFVGFTNDKSKIGTRVGMGYAMSALGVLAAGPASGAILGQNKPLNWRGLWIFCGVLSLISGVGYGAVRVIKYGPKLSVKA